MHPAIEQSAVSRSQDNAASSGVRKRLVSGKFSWTDSLFPLADQFTQHARISTYINAIVFFYVSFQMMFTSLWSAQSSWLFADSMVLDSFDYLSKTFWFISVKLDFDNNVTETVNRRDYRSDIGSAVIAYDSSYMDNLLIALIVIFVVLVALIIAEQLYYQRNHHYEKWTLILTRIVFEDISQIMIMPASAFVGASLLTLAKAKNNSYWAFLIVGVVILVAYFIVYITILRLTTRSTIIHRSVNSTFEFSPIMQLYIINVIFAILNYMFQLFPGWMMIVCQLIHFIAVASIFIKIHMSLPFHMIAGNTMFMAILTTSGVLDIAGVICYFTKNTSDSMIVLILWPVLYIISIVSISVVNILRYKRIRSHLTNPPDTQTNDDELFQKFFQYGLQNSEVKALCYMRIGFTQILNNFVDFSIVRFIAANHQSNHSMISMIQILSYFPTEARQLNSIFNIVCSKNDLKFEERFLLYQMFRLKSLRQSSTSNDSNEKLVKLRALTEQCTSDVLMFWKSSNPDISYFEHLSKEEHKLQSLWLESIRDYPNSAKFCEEYVRFLSECMTDFQKAILVKQRGDLIDIGKSFSIDTTFRAMVRSFPDYLRKDIVDCKGNFRKKQDKNKGSSLNESQPQSTMQTESTTGNTGSGSLDLSMTDTHELDAEIEDKLAKNMFTHSKLRLALYHALKGRKHFSLTGMPIFIIISFILVFAAFVGFYFYIKSTYAERKDSMLLLSYTSQTRFSLGIASFSLFLHYMNSTNKLDLNVINFDELELIPYISYNQPFVQTSLENSLDSRQYMNKLIEQVAGMAMKSIDVYDMASTLLERKVPLCVCWDGKNVSESKQNLKSSIAFSYYNQQRLSVNDNISYWYSDNNNYCELILNWQTISSNSNDLLTMITQYQTKRGEEISSGSLILMIAIPVVIFMVSFVPMMINSLIFVKYIDKIAAALTSMSREMKDQAMKPIRKNDQDIIQPSSEPKLGITKMVFFNIIQLVFGLAAAIIFLFMVWTADQGSKEIGQLVEWEKFAAFRLCCSLEGAFHALQVVVLGQPSISEFIDRPEEIIRTTDVVTLVSDSNNYLLKGVNDSKPCHGYDSILDELNMQETCAISSETTDFHDTYRCGSANQLISAYRDLITNIITDPNNYHQSVIDYDTVSLIHIINKHLWDRLKAVDSRCAALISHRYDQMLVASLIMMIFGIVVCIIIFAFGIIIKNYASNTLVAALAEVKRVPPLQMLQNKQIKNILLNKTDEVKGTGNSIARNILHKSADALLCTSMAGVIEIVNPSVTNILGFTPEQLLGQPASILFDHSHCEKVNNEMTMMKEGQSSSLYEDHLKCISDSGQVVPCHTTILGMKRDGSNAVESFVFILRDETELLEQQENAEKAKSQSENLLYQILPRDIVIKLNRGEKDISFSVPSATVMFIDIVKFSEYTASLTPQDIMGNLSLIFAAFDKLIKKYPLITKIKLIGDIYMAASGLFATEDCQTEHATQTIRFGLEALQELDDINVKLNANLQIRIGVNTGGPLIAGVLGTDKPVFDIIGDPINVAARLQTTDIPGKIQIPQSTFNLLSQLDFNLEPRGEVFLKGKGSVNTFFVNPGLAFTSFELTKNLTSRNTEDEVH